jgi:hypothetical protein
MNPFMTRFLIRSIILTLVFSSIGWILYTQVIPGEYQKVFPFILLFFFLATNIIHFYMLQIADKDIPKFTVRFMAMSSIKMLSYLIIGIVYVLIFTEQAKFFLLNYLIIYIGFTTLEVTEISRIVKLKK